jgi:hypothetical protein
MTAADNAAVRLEFMDRHTTRGKTKPKEFDHHERVAVVPAGSR